MLVFIIAWIVFVCGILITGVACRPRLASLGLGGRRVKFLLYTARSCRNRVASPEVKRGGRPNLGSNECMRVMHFTAVVI